MHAARWWFGFSSPAAGRDDAVPVGVGVVGEGHVEVARHVAQPRHRVRRGAVHADLAVPVERDEAEGRVELVVDDRQVEAVALGDRLPVREARAAQRVHPEPQPGAPDRVEVDHRRQVVDVGGDVVAPLDRGLLEGHAANAVQPLVEQPVGLALDPARDVGVGRPAVRRVVLEAAVAGRVVRRRDDDPVRQRPGRVAVVGEDRVRDHRRRRREVVGVDHHVDPVRREDLDDRAEGRLGERVRVAAEEQRALDPLLLAIAADRRADRDHVRLGERAVQRRAAVPGRAERHRLGGLALVVGGDQLADIDQVGRLGQPARLLVDRHRSVTMSRLSLM